MVCRLQIAQLGSINSCFRQLLMEVNKAKLCD
jgi:hypothetical protein